MTLVLNQNTHTHTKRKKKQNRNLWFTFRLWKLNMLAITEGGPAGCHSSLIVPQSIPIQVVRPWLLNTGWASTPESVRTVQEKCSADHCAPAPSSPALDVSDLTGGARWVPFSAWASAHRSDCCLLSWVAGFLLQRQRGRFSPPGILA